MSEHNADHSRYLLPAWFGYGGAIGVLAAFLIYAALVVSLQSSRSGSFTVELDGTAIFLLFAFFVPAVSLGGISGVILAPALQFVGQALRLPIVVAALVVGAAVGIIEFFVSFTLAIVGLTNPL